MSKLPIGNEVKGENLTGIIGPGEVNIHTVNFGAPPTANAPSHLALSEIFAEYVRRKTRGFVGRAHLFAEVQRFLATHASGYLTFVGEPGIGKSAFLCELTRRVACESHFFIRSDGLTRAAQLYDRLEDLLTKRLALELPADHGATPGVRLQRLFGAAGEALAGDKLVITIDALDECDDVSSPDQFGNVLFLPRILPDGIYIIATRRKLDPRLFNVRLETEPDVGNKVRDMMEFASENRQDVQNYLRSYYAERPDDPWIRAQKLTSERAVEILAERSQDNFMYLRHVLPHLAANPEAFAPTTLPRGLEEYYVGHWRRMLSESNGNSPDELLFATVYLLAVAREPLTAQLVANMLGMPNSTNAEALLARWREFLEEDDKSEHGYRIYHASFADFLLSQDSVDQTGRWRAANRSLKSWLLARLRAGMGV